MSARRFTDTKLVLASHNKGKLAEFQRLFAPFGVELIGAGDLGLAEPPETGTTFIENAMIKARVVAGDQQAGAQLLEMLRPFVYRR